MNNDNYLFVNVEFERILQYCLSCGVIDHNIGGCHKNAIREKECFNKRQDRHDRNNKESVICEQTGVAAMDKEGSDNIYGNATSWGHNNGHRRFREHL